MYTDARNTYKQVTEMGNSHTKEDTQIKSRKKLGKKVKAKKISDLKEGDHIKYRRLRGAYSHHAIVIAIRPENKEYDVIHFTDNGGRKVGDVKINKECKRFKRWKITVIEYDELDRLDRPVTVERAHQLLEKDYKITYNFVTNNCEHLATYCVLGKSKSDQVEESFLSDARIKDFVGGKSMNTQFCAKTVVHRI